MEKLLPATIWVCDKLTLICAMTSQARAAASQAACSAGGFCLRAPAQGACAYANICEHCPSFRTDTGYLPVLAAQKSDAEQLARDAAERGWITEADRHHKLIARLDDLITRAQAG